MLAAVISQRKKYRSAQALIDYIGEPDEQRARELAADLPPDAQALIEYAARAGVSEGGCSAVLRARSITDPTRDQKAITELFDKTVQAVRQAGTAADHPIYHVVLTWQHGEIPTHEQVEGAVEHTLQKLGMQDAATAWMIHRDKEHHHVHIAALRYGIETLEYLGPPKRDYLILDKAMREIELQQGWRHSPGPYVVQDGHIIKAPKQTREQVTRRPETSVEKAKGLPGIQAFCEHQRVGDALKTATSWDDLHSVANSYGLRLESKRGGVVIKAKGITADHAVKASAIDRALAGPALVKRLGPFLPPSPGAARRPAPLTFAAYQGVVAKGQEPAAQEQPGRTGRRRDPAKRQAQRAARSAARESLYEAFREHRQAAPGQRKAALAEVKERQQAERKVLFETMRSGRKSQLSDLAAAHGREVATLMIEGLEAQARAALETKHRAEKEAIKAQYSGNWRDWLEMRARVHGDPAAISALRGIKYREGRKGSQEKPGIEGEDLRLEVPSSTQSAVGSIAGDDRWGLDQAKIEVSRDGTSVIYKDADGKERLRDEGQRIELSDAKDEDAMLAALTLAAKRYGGEVYITGDREFRERAAAECRRQGIEIANIELRNQNQRAQSIDNDLGR